MKHKEKSNQTLFQRLKAYVRTPDALRLLIVVVTMVLCLAMFIAAISPIRYNLRVGMVPTHTIAATKDVVDEVTTEQPSAGSGRSGTHLQISGKHHGILHRRRDF